jgi:hypothetical protein
VRPVVVVRASVPEEVLSVASTFVDAAMLAIVHPVSVDVPRTVVAVPAVMDGAEAETLTVWEAEAEEASTKAASSPYSTM